MTETEQSKSENSATEISQKPEAEDAVTRLANEIEAYHTRLFVDGKEESISTQINEYFADLFTDAEDSPSVKTQIDGFQEEITEQSGAVQKLHDDMLVDTEGKPSLKSRITKIKKTIVEQADAIDELHGRLLVDGENPSTKKQIDDFHDELFADREDKKGLKILIQEAQKKASKQAEEIDTLHDRLLVDDEGENANTCLSTDIDKFYDQLFKDSESTKGTKTQISDLHTDATNKTEDIKGYHKELLVDSAEKKSLKTEINNYWTSTQSDFDKLKKDLTKKIEDLLPSASAAGLASSYNTARTGYAQWYSQLFYYALLLLPLGYCAHLYTNPPESLVALETAVMAGKADYTTLMIFRALLALPLLAISLFGFSSLRLSRRMAEEYNHKQRVMELYTGFKKEIDALAIEMEDKQEGLELKNALLHIMLRTVEQHPSQAMKEVDRGWLGDLVQVFAKRTKESSEEPDFSISAKLPGKGRPKPTADQ